VLGKIVGRALGEYAARKLATKQPPTDANYRPLIEALQNAKGVTESTVQDLARHTTSKADCMQLVSYLKSEAARNIDITHRAEMVRELLDKVRLFDLISHLH
jgi:hypothetical protein